MATEKQRREAARRKLERQIERREELERQRKNRLAWMWGVAGLVVVALVIFLVAVNTSDSGSDNQASGPEGCDYQADPTSDLAVGLPPAEDVPTEGTVTLNVATSAGPMVFSLDRASAPCAVNSFEFLAQQGFFDGSPCHRMTTEEAGFGVLQCGDPTGTGSGGAGYRYAEEPPTSSDPYPEGTLAMANSGQPSSTGSQFFICYTSCSSLPPNYSVVGTVSEGLDVVKQIAAAGVTVTDPSRPGDGAPTTPVTLDSVTVA
ncbi:peptidylprolyl isomerase [Epidermidibacterium keratini]|uniref:Peptidylprolyl isomerase n=1 Tax=Epidermidibacterium keratini TaxID=1891644 RepID=A0A7L4YIS8_9ACTN|nr:peptidylprolyl isomerase [Epidermidibacterium keratini]QHB99061.1 peptidylprolyl isomerase [Epidermidibacterium keratini]